MKKTITTIIGFRVLLWSFGSNAAEIEAKIKADLKKQQDSIAEVNMVIADSIANAKFVADYNNASTSTNVESPTDKTIYQLLQGKWQSIDDAKSIIEFKNEYYADYYDNVKGEENKFWLDKGCPDSKESGNAGENEKYLVVGDMCWFIVNVTESRLELNYTARGNTLVYKKIK
jgi:hypothetical protein